MLILYASSPHSMCTHIWQTTCVPQSPHVFQHGTPVCMF